MTRETEVDQSGIDDGHSMLDKLNGDELTETLTHILARLRLSESKVNWPSDPGNRPYLQVKPLMADVQSLFAQTKKLHGKTSSQAEHIRSLQRLWLSQCSDRLEPCPQPKAEELHKAWHAAKAERKEPYMLTDAQQKLQQSVEDTSNSKSNKASAYIDAVRQAVYLLYVFLDCPIMADDRQNLLAALQRILRRLKGCFTDFYRGHRYQMQLELRELLKDVDKAIDDFQALYANCDLPALGDLPEVQATTNPGRQRASPNSSTLFHCCK